MIIRVQNNLTIEAPQTFFSVSKDASVGTINVKNTNGFSSNWAVQIGNTGEEKSEIKIASTASGTNIVLTEATTFDHPSDTPVYAIKFDQIVFEKSSSGTAGTATPIAGGTISITPDNTYTQFDDTNGLSSDAYRTYFRNSVTDETSSESDWLTSTGFSFYSLAKIRDRIRGKLFNSSYIKNDEQINDWVNEWLEEMNNAIVDIDKSYSLGTVNVGFGTDGMGTVTSDDFKSFKKIWVTYDGTNKYKATKLDLSKYYPNEIYNEAHPYYVWQGDDVFQVLPSTQSGTAEITYYKRAPLLVNDTDELPFAMRSYSKSFVNYALSEAYYNDDKDAKGQAYLGRALADKNNFIKEMTPRNFGDIETIQISYEITGDEDERLYQ